MANMTLPIVGAFYRPPAQLVCNLLPIGQPLVLYAEPDNQFDANAVAVWLLTETLNDATKEALGEELPSAGLELEQFLAQPMWHLGYVPKEFAANLKADGIVVNEIALDAKFATTTTGKPAVVFDATPA